MNVLRFDNLLAIDTATRRLHLALMFAGDRVVKSSDAVAKSHGQVLMARLEALLASAAIGTERLDAIVVSVGPGSFTGLRIGLAAAKGLAIAHSIPLLGVGLFDLAAWKLAATGCKGAVIIPSRKGEYYLAAIDAVATQDINVTVTASKDLRTVAGGRTVYGLGFDPAAELSEADAVRSGGELEYDAADLLYLGRERLLKGERSDLARLEPAYFQKAIAEVRFDERHGADRD